MKETDGRSNREKAKIRPTRGPSKIENSASCKQAATRLGVAEIIASIENDVVAGHYRPGTRLDERELSIRFGVSRTPIREALNRLVASGLVESRPRHGMHVACITLSEFLQIYEVMSELEALCARLAARRMTEAERRQLTRLQDAGQSIVKRRDKQEYGEHNVALHELIYQGCHNDFLADNIRTLRRRLGPYRRFSFQLGNRLEESNAEHARIVDRIVSGDSEEASIAMRSHMDIHRRNFGDFILLLSKVLPPG